MTQVQLITDIGVWGVNVAFIAAILFPFVVRLFWAWEKSEWGINIVALESTIALALFPTWLRRALHVGLNTYLFGWIIDVSIWGIAAIIVWRTIIIWHDQRYRIPENGDNDQKKEEKVP